jgi:ATP-dependent exoDNAse (exonuclease V) beta subunit
VRGINVLETAAVRDLLAALRCLTMPPDAESLFRVAAFPVFALDPQAVREATYAASVQARQGDGQNVSFDSVLRRVAGGEAVLSTVEEARAEAQRSAMRASIALTVILRRFQLDPSAAAVDAFARFVDAWEKKPITRTKSISELIEYLDFFSQAGGSVELPTGVDGDAETADPDVVRLMTVHAAKGMEFDHVFLLRVRQSSFPASYREKLFEFPPELRKSLSAEGDDKAVHSQEERRLFYVGMTRARDSLLVYARPSRSRKDPRPAGLPRELMESPSANGFWRMRDAAPYSATLAAAAAPSCGVASWILYPPSGRLASPGLSASGIETYERCPLEFKLRRDWSLPGRISGSLQFGAIMHTVLKDYYDAVKAGRPRCLENVLELFRATLEGVHFDDPVQRDLYLRDGIRQLSRFVVLREQEPPPAVLQTERGFEMKVGAVLIRGRIDRVDRLAGSGVAIVDYKTGAAKTQMDADNSLQLSIYMIAAQSLWNLAPERLILYNLADNSMVETCRTQAELDKVREHIQEVAGRIARGEFDPKPGYHCRGCLYRGLCPATEQDVALPSPAEIPRT